MLGCLVAVWFYCFLWYLVITNGVGCVLGVAYLIGFSLGGFLVLH